LQEEDAMPSKKAYSKDDKHEFRDNTHSKWHNMMTLSNLTLSMLMHRRVRTSLRLLDHFIAARGCVSLVERNGVVLTSVQPVCPFM
jgi:hypothetical protein